MLLLLKDTKCNILKLSDGSLMDLMFVLRCLFNTKKQLLLIDYQVEKRVSLFVQT